MKFTAKVHFVSILFCKPLLKGFFWGKQFCFPSCKEFLFKEVSDDEDSEVDVKKETVSDDEVSLSEDELQKGRLCILYFAAILMRMWFLLEFATQFFTVDL